MHTLFMDDLKSVREEESSFVLTGGSPEADDNPYQYLEIEQV